MPDYLDNNDPNGMAAALAMHLRSQQAVNPQPQTGAQMAAPPGPQGLARQRALGMIAGLIGGKQMGSASEVLLGNANQQETFQRQTPGIQLQNLLAQQKLKQEGPQAGLGGETPTNYELLTKREQVPKFASGFPGSQIYNTRTGKVAAAGGSGDIVEQTADAIQKGLQPPDLKGLNRMSVPVRAALARRGFDLSSAQQEWTATQHHLATMNGQQQTRLAQAVDFTSHSLDNIEQLYEQWKQVGVASGVRMFNRAALGASKQLPGQAGATAQALEGQINDLTAELSNVYMGGNSPTDHAIKLAQQNLGADWNEETFRKAIQQIRTNLQMRKNAMQSSPTAGVGSRYDAPQAQPQAAAQAPTPTQQASPEDAQALEWLKANPQHPAAIKVAAKLKSKGLLQ